MPGPLVADWIAWSLEEARAGALGSAQVEIANAGSATWREDVACSYHWLDLLGNPIVWDGLRSTLPRSVGPGERISLGVRVRAPIPPGRYRFALDLVAEHRAWFAEVGPAGPDEEVDVAPRVESASLEAVADLRVPGGWELAPGSAELLLAAHSEGYAAVAGSIEAPRRLRKALAPWSSSAGRDPAFAHPLLCPSVLKGIELEPLGDVEGLPAFAPPVDEPWLYDGRVVLRPAR